MLFVQETVAEFCRRQAKGTDIREHIEGPCRHTVRNAVDPVQQGEDEGTPLRENITQARRKLRVFIGVRRSELRP